MNLKDDKVIFDHLLISYYYDEYSFELVHLL
jgi:hypothetical protein